MMKLKATLQARSNNLNKLQKASNNLTIGVHKDAAARSGDSEINNATLLAIHVFGSIINNIPSRDPLLKPIREHKTQIMQLLYKHFHEAIKKNIQGKSKTNTKDLLKKVLNEIGFYITENIVKYEIHTNGRGKWQALTDATVKRKFGSTQMLMQTMELINSIGFKVES